MWARIKADRIFGLLLVYCGSCLLAVAQLFGENGDLLQGSIANQWRPATLPDRTDLQCECVIDPTEKETERCCSCYARCVWGGTQRDLIIEYISRHGESVILSENQVNKSLVYRVVHKNGQLTEMPSNLCNWEDTNNKRLWNTYQDELDQHFWERIVQLDFSFNKIYRIVNINCLRNLDYLDLSFNRLTHLSNVSFNQLTHLRYLLLRRNMIDTIDAVTFSAPTMHLTTVDLSNNSMKSVDVTNTLSQYPFCRIDFTNNAIDTISNQHDFKLNISRTYGPGMVTFAENRFNQFIDFKESLGLDDLAKLGRLLQFNFNFTNNDVDCNCILEPLLEHAKDFVQSHWSDYMNVTCYTPEHLNGIPLVKVNLDDYICNVSAERGCPKTCSCFDQPSTDTMNIDCSNRGLTEIPNHVPHSEYSTNIALNLTGNEIVSVSNVSYFENVTLLNMSHNRLTNIDEDAAKALSSAIIDISGNMQLHHLPQALQYKHLSQVHMDNLVLECNCDSKWLANWMSVKGNREAQHLKCNVPGQGTIPANKFSVEQLDCDADTAFVKLLALSLGGILVTLGIVGTILLYFNYELFIIFLRMRQTTKHNYVNPSFDFDLFLSFDSENDKLRHWVSTILLTCLENKGYITFYPCRDLTYGSERSSETINVLQRTRHFILILSDSYLEQEDHIWTDNEWKYGWNMLKSDSRRKIILINYDHISSFDVSHPQIKAYLRVGDQIEFNNHHGDLLETIALKLGPPCIRP